MYYYIFATEELVYGISIYTHILLDIFMFCDNLCIHIYLCMYTYVYAHVYIYKQMLTYLYIHMYVHVCKHTNVGHF